MLFSRQTCYINSNKCPLTLPLVGDKFLAAESDRFLTGESMKFPKTLDGTYNETVPYFECVVGPNIPSDSCPVDQFQL